MRFSTRMLLVQVATQLAVVAVCVLVFVLVGVQQLRAEAESSALNIARTVAENVDVRTAVAEYSADPGTPDAAELRSGALQAYALGVTERTEGLFVVITDDHGIRLAHPTPERIGEVVSTSFAEALAGQEVVSWETGTLGASARAKVPIYPPGGGEPVGEVSVGFEPTSVLSDLPSLLGGIAVAAVIAVALGITAALLLRRRLEKLTLGVQPEEFAALVQTQTAVVETSGDGVIACDPDGVIRVCNAAATRMLALIEQPVGTRLDDLPTSAAVVTALHEGAPDGIVAGARVLYIDVRGVSRGGRRLGRVAVIRDRTDLVSLTERLETVRTMSDALRVQRHEFANRMHAVAGLISADRTAEALDFVHELAGRGSVDYNAEGLDAISDPLLQSFIGAKALSAAERGVTLVVGEDTLLRGTLADVEDAAAVLGNLIDNAITAAVAGAEPRRVEVTLLDDGDTLVATVHDSGAGLEGDPFAPEERRDVAPEAIHGHGIGLALSRELARRRGGDVWVIDSGGVGTGGASFGARLPGAITATEERS